MTLSQTASPRSSMLAKGEIGAFSGDTWQMPPYPSEQRERGQDGGRPTSRVSDGFGVPARTPNEGQSAK